MSSNTCPSSENSIGRRSDARVRLCVPARLLLVDGNLKCVLIDLSRTGASVAVDTAAMPSRGSSAFLVVNGLEAFGTVVWIRGNRCGVHFDEKLALADVVAMREFADKHKPTDRAETERAARDFVQGRIRIP